MLGAEPISDYISSHRGKDSTDTNGRDSSTDSRDTPVRHQRRRKHADPRSLDSQTPVRETQERGMVIAATTANVAAKAIRYFLMFQVDLSDRIDLVPASRRASFHQKLGSRIFEKGLS